MATLSPEAGAGDGQDLGVMGEAIQPGRTLLRLVYHRTWEESTIPAETFQVIVVVK